MLAGEGLGGVLQALLAIAKVDGSREYQSTSWSSACLTLVFTVFGTAIGCPGLEFCG